MNDTESEANRLMRAIRAFHEAGLRLVLIGGVALLSHGIRNQTRDTDFAYGVEPENLERLAAFLFAIHARILGRPSNDGFVISPELLRRVRFLTYPPIWAR